MQIHNVYLILFYTVWLFILFCTILFACSIHLKKRNRKYKIQKMKSEKNIKTLKKWAKDDVLLMNIIQNYNDLSILREIYEEACKQKNNDEMRQALLALMKEKCEL